IERGQLRLALFDGGRNLSSLYELIGTKVLIPGATPRDPSSLVDCPLNDSAQVKQVLPLMLDKLTTNSNQDLPARINVLTAPHAVLAALPGLTEGDISAIQSARQAANLTDATYATPAWL